MVKEQENNASGAVLELRGLSKTYAAPPQPPAVDGVSLSVQHGQTLALLGPSGSGKSTVLRMIAGLEPPTAGQVWLRGQQATHWPPEARRCALVFQDYALFPHLRVLGNVAYGLQRQKVARAQANLQARQMLQQVGLEGLEQRYPHELSGGQQQRVALARALATKPDLLLLDEPLSNLDEQLRASLRRELRQLFGQLGTSVILVTHDQREAVALADQVAIMRGGVVAQQGQTTEVFARPTSAWVAAFLGYQNLLPAESGEVLLVPEEAIILGQGERCEVLDQQQTEYGSEISVRHPLGTLQLRLSPRESQNIEGQRMRLQVDQKRCLVLKDDRS